MRLTLSREEVSLIIEALEEVPYSPHGAKSWRLEEKLAKLLAKDSKEWKEDTKLINEVLREKK